MRASAVSDQKGNLISALNPRLYTYISSLLVNI